jgi:hypothetical protein
VDTKDWRELPGLEDPNFLVKEPWIKILDYVIGPKILKIQVQGQWSLLGPGVRECTETGHPGLAFPSDRLLLPDSAPGAMIGKLGGSTADYKDGTLFAIGSYAVVFLEEKKILPLFVGINGMVLTSLPKTVNIKVKVSVADHS